MSIKYDSTRIPLSSIISNTANNFIYLIPDLQRPYVWTPSQVILLIDSLFKGWPFDSLLLWEVDSNCYAENEGIPHRPFWREVKTPFFAILKIDRSGKVFKLTWKVQKSKTHFKGTGMLSDGILAGDYEEV